MQQRHLLLATALLGSVPMSVDRASAAVIVPETTASASAADPDILTFDWYFDIAEGDGKGQRVTGTLTGIREGDNMSYPGGEISAQITSSPWASMFVGGPDYIDGDREQTKPYIGVTVRNGIVTLADINLYRIDQNGIGQGLFLGYSQNPKQYSPFPELYAWDSRSNTTLFNGTNSSGKVVFSPSLGPVAAVPEPATWAMMICGFGIVGGALRRRRATVAFA